MILQFDDWKPPVHWLQIKTIDLHTGGEPLRVVYDGLPPILGNTILEKIQYFRDHLDDLRTGLMWEPRGHADMYGAVITEPVTEDGDFGTFFLHNEGYSTMCGHAMIALVKLVLDTGYIKPPTGSSEIRIDAPPGRIIAWGDESEGMTQKSTFQNVPSFVLYQNKKVHVEGIGTVWFDVAYGGAFYAFVEAEQLDLGLVPENLNKLIDLGRRIKKAVKEHLPIEHPFEKELSFLYGTIFTGLAHQAGNHSRNVCIFADGEVDRSSTGSGVSARAALHHAKGELKPGERITIESILGTVMEVEISDEVSFGPYNAVIPRVSGTAAITGRHQFYFDPGDPLSKGFIFR